MKVYKLNEISESRLLYDKNPPKFMVMLIFIVTALLISFIIWSYFSIRTYVVKGQGIVTTDQKAQIMAKASGEIAESYMQEGKDVHRGDVLLKINPVESNLQLNQVCSQLEILEKRLSLLIRAEYEATKGINTFNKNYPDEVEFYNRLTSSYIKRKEFKVDEAKLKAQGYTDDQIKQYMESAKSKLNELYYSTILEFTNEKTQVMSEKNKLESQKKAVDDSAKEFTLLASCDGKLHINTTINKGMVLQAGTLLGSINGSGKGIVIETMLPSSDRPRIKVGDEVSIAVNGLNQSEFGTISGSVKSIDEDATIDKEKSNIFFKVIIVPCKNFLQDKKDEKVNLSNGMLTEIRVKYDKISYLNYFIEQLGIKFD